MGSVVTHSSLSCSARSLSLRIVTALGLAATAVAVLPAAASAMPDDPGALTFTVNSDAPTASSANDGTCDVDAATDGPQCTLAEAINEANANPGLDTIGFDTTGFATPGLIERSTSYPAIVDAVSIDGTTDPAYDPDQDPVVHLAGPGAYRYLDGLFIGWTNGSTIRGLTLTGWGTAISASGTQTTTVVGNQIGVADDGIGEPEPSNIRGFYSESSVDTTIGGAATADRNIMNNNSISVQDSSSTRIRVLGNSIGFDRDGDDVISVADQYLVYGPSRGVDLSGTTTAQIGGPGAGNVVANTGYDAVEASYASDIAIENNTLGLDPAGNTCDAAQDSTAVSLVFTDGASVRGNLLAASNVAVHTRTGNGASASLTLVDNVIGYNRAGSARILGDCTRGAATLRSLNADVVMTGNEIASTGATDYMVSADGGSIRATGNVLGAPAGTPLAGPRSNVGFLLDPAAASEVSDNEVWGARVPIRVNNSLSSSTLLRRNLLAEASLAPIEVYRDQQPAPVLDLARADGTGTRVKGTVNTAPGRALELDVFSSATCGQAERFLETLTATADGTGRATFNEVLDASVPAGRVLNATASDTTRTSHLSTCRTVTAPPTVSIADTTLTEGDSGQSTATFEVTLSAPHDVETSVRASTFESFAVGAATLDQDYDAVDTRLVFAPGQTTATLEVPVDGDVLHETDEFFKVVLSDPEGIGLGGTIARAVITDDDAAPTFSTRDVTVTEPETGSSYPAVLVRLSATSGTPTPITYTTSDGTAGQRDYVTKTATTTIPAGDRARRLVFRVRPDALDEDPETFTVTATNPDAPQGEPARAQVTIADSDPQPTLTLTDLTLDEGEYGQLSLRLPAPSGRTVTATWATTPGTAGPGDFFANQGTVTFAPGTTRQVIGVRTRGDRVDDPGETYAVTITGATHADIPTTGGQITIR